MRRQGSVHVKICGMTSVDDALAAETAGADAVGLIFVKDSKRFIEVSRAAQISAALGPLIARVGVFMDAPLEWVQGVARELQLSAVQLHGAEDAAYARALRRHVRVIKAYAFHPELEPATLASFPADAILLDGLKPGSGERFDWSQAAALAGAVRLMLAGGLNPENVASGIRALSPYAVDVASGVESSPGRKDVGKIQDFVRIAKSTGYPQLSTAFHKPVDNS